MKIYRLRQTAKKDRPKANLAAHGMMLKNVTVIKDIMGLL